MAKTKLKDRIKEQISKLFNNRSDDSENLASYNESSISQTHTEFHDEKEPNNIFTFLRQALLFAPGAILLWITSGGIIGSILLGTLERVPIWAYPVFILSFFMTTLGLSDFRKPKNFLIPLSTVLFGAVFGVVSVVFTEPLRLFVNFVGNEMFFSLAVLIWLVPLFTKLWLDTSDNE